MLHITTSVVETMRVLIDNALQKRTVAISNRPVPKCFGESGQKTNLAAKLLVLS